MSRPVLPSPPLSEAEFAWPSGDVPGVLEFRHEPPSRVREAIIEAVKPSFAPLAAARTTQVHSLSAGDGPAGRYRVATECGTWFIRVSARQGVPQREQEFVRYLDQQGVMVNPLLAAGVPLHWEGRQFRLDVRPFIQGRHFDGSPEDVRQVARSVAACHRALTHFPDADAVRAAAARWNRGLADVVGRLAEALSSADGGLFAERAPWMKAHRAWLTRMTRACTPLLDEAADAQCLHGEVHPGNVCFTAGGEAVLVDFEESVHRFAPPAWDLAFLVQRFCLSDEPSLELARQRLHLVADGYGVALPPLAEMMRQAAWHSLATLLWLRFEEGIVAPAQEYDKFVHLEQQVACYEGVL